MEAPFPAGGRLENDTRKVGLEKGPFWGRQGLMIGFCGPKTNVFSFQKTSVRDGLKGSLNSLINDFFQRIKSSWGCDLAALSRLVINTSEREFLILTAPKQ